MQVTEKRKEKMIELGRHAFAVLGGGVMISYANLLLLVGLIGGELFLFFILVFGVLIGMMTTELPQALASGLLAHLLGVLTFFGFIVLSMGGAVTWQLAEVLVYFATMSMTRVLLLSFFAGVLIGPVIGRIVGPEWHQVDIAKHQLRIPLPKKEDT